MAAFPWPVDLAERHARLRGLLEQERNGELARTLETELQGDSIKTLFEGVLGYRTRLGGDGRAWSLSPERNVAASGALRADSGIGWFSTGGTPTVHAVRELKGASQDLDTARSRALTPVQQAWNYAVQSSTCRWILVSNYRELRLYHRSRSQAEFERFRLRDLVELEPFRRLIFLLSEPQLLPSSPLDSLLTDSDRSQVEITDRLYKDYRATRAALLACSPLVLAPSNSLVGVAATAGEAVSLLSKRLWKRSVRHPRPSWVQPRSNSKLRRACRRFG